MEFSTSGHPAESPEVGESNESSSLLSLTGKVDDLLLPFVASGDGGLQAVLNLRKVCSTTKGWVDGLASGEGRRLFRKSTANVDLSGRDVEEFVEAPPPSGESGDTGVTSLYLTHTDSLSEERFPLEKEELWSRFVAIWAPKLEFLEVDVLFLPLNLKLDPLLSLESLRSLRCDTIKYNELKSGGLPESLFRFEELSVGRLEMAFWHEREFFSRLSTQQNLKRLTLKVEDEETLNGVVGLIERKKAAEDFKLSLTVDAANFHAFGGQDRDMYRLKALYVRLAISVANSSASIRISGLRDVELFEYIREDLDQETAQRFFKSIVGMSCHFFTSYTFGWNLRAIDFPNLETFTLESHYYAEYLKTLEATAFPPTLKKLQVKDGLPRPASLPATLTHLDLMHNLCSVNGLLQGLLSLAENCRSLRNLKMKWEHFDEPNTESDPFHGFQSFSSSTKFKDLKSLDFCAEIEDASEAAVCRMILLHGFKLSQLNLRDLKLSFIGDNWDTRDRMVRVVDHNILVALNSGPVSKSLWNVDIDPGYVTEDAIPLLDVLKSKAAENKRKRVETHGKERERPFDR